MTNDEIRMRKECRMSRGHFKTIETRSVSEEGHSFPRASLTLRVTKIARKAVLKCPLGNLGFADGDGVIVVPLPKT